MSKKAPKFIMLSGWLPVCYSHYRQLESFWVGSNALTTDEFYGALKMIADDLNDNISKKKIKKNIEKFLKDSDIAKYRPEARNYLIDALFQLGDEYFAINKYYTEFNNNNQSNIDNWKA